MTGYPQDPIPQSELDAIDATLEYFSDVPDTLEMPQSFSAQVLLMPFSPPQGPHKDDYCPFFQVCTANLAFQAGEYLSLQIKGAEYGTFWYIFRPGGGQVSVDGGPFTDIPASTGWTMPGQDFFYGQPSKFVGVGPMNWIEKENGMVTGWWKAQVPGTPSSAPGANWIWCYPAATAGMYLPKRMMFGVQPPSPVTGNPKQLPVLQNFSFSYFSGSVWGAELPTEWVDPAFPGFSPGNPNGTQPFIWQANQGITVMMTPVNEAYDPMPTRVLYRWDDDQKFTNGGARGQSTLLHYTYDNPDHHSLELALLTRMAPSNDEKGFNAYYFNEQAGPGKAGHIDWSTSTDPKHPFPFGTQPPNWVTLGQGTIHGTLIDNQDFCPGLTLNMWGVHFPPSAPNYPEDTYLWTWYNPLDATGTLARPVVFMQSSSALGKGTSLALADYFYFEVFSADISAEFFQIPPLDYLTFS